MPEERQALYVKAPIHRRIYPQSKPFNPDHATLKSSYLGTYWVAVNIRSRIANRAGLQDALKLKIFHILF